MNRIVIGNAVGLAVFMVVAGSAQAETRKQPTEAKVAVAAGTLAASSPTRVQLSNAKTKYCFTQEVSGGELKTTCRTKRQWSNKGITVLTD